MKAPTSLDQFEAWELEAVAEGGNVPHLAAFIEQHPALWSAWLQSYQRAQNSYKALHRFDCPTPDALRNYYWSMVAPAQQAQIAGHLAICLSCTAEYQALVESLAVDDLAVDDLAVDDLAVDTNFTSTQAQALPVTPNTTAAALVAQLRESIESFANQLKWTVATLVSPATVAVAPAALRSAALPSLDAAQPTTLLFETAAVDLNLVLQKQTDETITLNGQLLVSDATADAQIKVAALDATFGSVQVPVNAVGEFRIDGLVPGTYQLFATFQDQVIVIPNLFIA